MSFYLCTDNDHIPRVISVLHPEYRGESSFLGSYDTSNSTCLRIPIWDSALLPIDVPSSLALVTSMLTVPKPSSGRRIISPEDSILLVFVVSRCVLNLASLCGDSFVLGADLEDPYIVPKATPTVVNRFAIRIKTGN